jgi:hypothetical protein
VVRDITYLINGMQWATWQYQWEESQEVIMTNLPG